MNKFTPIPLGNYFNVDRSNTPIEGQAPWNSSLVAFFDQLQGGEQTFWGIPFQLGIKEGGNCWLLLGTSQTEIPLPPVNANYIVIAHFCNPAPDPRTSESSSSPDIPAANPGVVLGEYCLLYADGSQHSQPIRRRFEVNDVTLDWGHLAYLARPHLMDSPADWRGPYGRNAWGFQQTAVRDGAYEQYTHYWIYAMPNPHPEKPLSTLVLRSTGSSSLAVAGITLYHGQEHPLRHKKLEVFQITLPTDEARPVNEIETKIDLGIISRKESRYFDGQAWLVSLPHGWGEEALPAKPVDQFVADITASPEATLKVAGHAVDLKEAYQTGKSHSGDGKVIVELINSPKTWVRVTVEDAVTGKPTPVRVHFHSPQGQYLPPYGHRHEVNDNWFEDYGGDLKLGSTQYAYVDGRFLIELPVGEVYTELSKGFEYRPVRQKITIQPGQQELKLLLDRPINLRQQGWVTADTHTHFISPQTAFLEAQGEGVNLVNLLASQWGDLFTNVADITGAINGASRDDTIVWVGTENRQHLLGHISMLGTHGDPVFPMCAGGPSESYLGDPVWSSLADWADTCRKREGVVVLPHFPHPLGELVADILLGKIDGAEIRDFFIPTINTYSVREWYRFLNLGYRLAAVGGTDKMSAGMPVGGVRTYAQLGDEEFSFENWGKSIRAGRTFTTNGPLLSLKVEGKTIGDEIRLPSGGGTLEIEASGISVQPFHELQLVVNGNIVASESSQAGSEAIHIKTKLRLERSSWIAARCSGKLRLWHCWPVYTAAHTSPVYVQVGDERMFSPSDATYMLTLLEGGLAWLDTLSIQADPERFQRVRSIFTTAQEHLTRRMQDHSHGHH